MNVKLRVMKTQADYVVSVRNSDKVQTLKQGFISRNPDVEASKIKLLYGGKALED